MAKEIHFRQIAPKSEIHYRPVSMIPGTVDFPTTEEPMMFRVAPKPSALGAEWKAWKEHALFPAKEGYGGGRWTKPTREEWLRRGLTFVPQKLFSGIGAGIERFVETIPAGYVKPLFAAVGKGRLERIAFEELHPKKFAESIAAAGRTAFRRPGVPREAPTMGEMIGKEFYEPMVGKPAPAYYAPVMDAAFSTVILFGPKALQERAARKLATADKIIKKYNVRIRQARTRHDAKAIESLRAMEQEELSQVMGPRALRPKVEVGKARLGPTRFKEPWVTVGGKKYKAGEAIAEASLEVESPVQQLGRLLGEAKKVQPQYEKIKHLELQRRAAEITTALKRYKGEKAWSKAYAAAKGEITPPDFTPPGLSMSSAAKSGLAEQLRLSKKFLPFEYLQAKKGLVKLLGGHKPEPGQIELLEREFGPELVKSIIRITRTFPQKAGVVALDIANMPRTFLTAYDLSFSLRQGYIAGLRHPVKWSKAFVAQVKAFGSERNALAIENSIRTGRYWPEMVKYKLYQPSVTGVAEPLAMRPEEFMSRFARVIPGIKASERAFITMGNKLRADIFSGTMKMWKGTGKTTKDYKLLAQYINALTGRGKLPLKFLEQHGAAMNAAFFSPRWVSSRIQLATRAARALPWAVTGGMVPAHPVSKMAAADIVTLVGVNTSALAAMKFYWGDKVDIELDPRSSDFGKIRVGNSRWEAFAGYQPLARYTAQALTGERKQTLTGRMFQTTPEEVGKRFLRSKLSPMASFAVDLYTSETFIGDEMSRARLGLEAPEEAKMPWQKKAGAVAENLLFKRFFPIVGQDIIDAAVYQGAGEAAITAPVVILGFGGGTYPPSKGQQLALLQDGAAQKMLGKPWDDTGPMSQQFMRNRNPEWEERKRVIKYERQQRGVTEISKREQNEAGENVHKRLSATMKRYMKESKVSIGGLPRKLGEWRLNDARYVRYQELITEDINQSALMWKEKPHRQVIENVIRMAKETAHSRMIVDANIEDK